MIAPLLLAGAALQSPCANPLLIPSPSPWYVSLIARYRGGGRESAVSESIPSERFRAEIAALAQLLGYHQRQVSCPVRADLEAVTRETAMTLKAAVLLHTDRAFRLFDRGDGGAPLEMQAASQLLSLMDASAEQAFGPRWARAAALEFSRHGKWDGALGVLDPALEDHPDDPLLLLARGAVLESLCRLDHALRVDRREGAWAQARARKPAESGQKRARLERAESHYRQALALRKDLLHARVRLGRVLQLLDQTGESIRELEAVVASDPALLEARDAYLARLFLGYAHEHAGALDQAVSEYERALGAVPDGQAAAVALSHALHREGRWPASLESLQRGVVRAGQRLVLDPWWPYVAGQIEDPAELFEELRAEVTP